MFKKIALLMAMGAVTLVSTQLYAAGDLDGTKWVMKEGRLPIGRKDTLKFEAGNFTSVECIPYGFNAGPYTSSKEGQKITWTSTQRNSKGETMQWEGTWDGTGKMKGNYAFTDEKGKFSKTKWTARKEK